MPFKSEAQRRYFYYKASQPGEEGKKWKKHLRKYRESTPKGVKLPERVKTASRAKGFAKFRHMTRDIQSLADASLHSPDVLLYRSVGRDGPIERRIVIGAPIEYRGARFKTPFFESTGTGSKNTKKGEMIPFNWVEGKKPSADRGRKKGQGIWINKYFPKKQPPPGHPLHLQKLRLEAMDRKGLLTPTHVIDEYKMGAGRRYAGPLAVNAWLRERGYHRTLLPEVQSDLQSILKYIEGRTMITKTSAQNAFEYSFFEEIDKIANELSKTEKAIYTLPALGTLAGAAFGAASPVAFHPESMFPKIVKKHGLSSARARALSAMLGAGTGATLASIPAMAYDVVQMHRPRKKKKESK